MKTWVREQIRVVREIVPSRLDFSRWVPAAIVFSAIAASRLLTKLREDDNNIL